MTSIAPLPPVSCPEVPVLDAAKTTPEMVIKGLALAGGVIVRNLVPVDNVNKVAEELEPLFDGQKVWQEGGFFPTTLRMATGLASRSKAFVEYVIKNKLYQDVCNDMLSTTTSNWNGSKQEVSVSKPQLCSTTAFRTTPGSKNQGLHRDDMIHHNNPKPAVTVEQYNSRRDTGINLFVAGRKSTKANGATRFIPGSHLWDSNTLPDESLCQWAELNPGDGFITLDSVLHGGSANTTENEVRLLFCVVMIRGYLRQEENQYLANDIQKMLTLHDRETLELLGFGLSLPYMGWVNLEHPLKPLYGDKWMNDVADDLF